MERTIRMKGRATVTAPSDITVVSMNISGKETGFAEALDTMSRTTGRLKDLISSARIERDSVKTSDLKVEQSYRKVKIGTDRNGYDKFKEVEDGFDYYQKIHFEFPTDNTVLSDVIKNVGKSGATPRIIFSFRNSDPEGMKNRALAEACRHAKEEAETIVTAVGAKLGKLLSVDRSFRTYSDYDDERGYDMPLESACLSETMDIDPEDYSVDQSVEMVWEITD
ncbi:MAG: SIMPL domain-containing protein [Candidatus Methanomethylophilaceae archaeon]|nr:SIMPL domain-containing protein [Candidatus Methanomethylophilaceae archaeon]